MFSISFIINFTKLVNKKLKTKKKSNIPKFLKTTIWFDFLKFHWNI